MTTEDITITNAMDQYGGSFVRALARAFRVADEMNRRRIKNAFPDIWERYEAATFPDDALKPE